MKKTHLILLAIPALMLSGCTKEISKEEAKDVATKIAAKQKEEAAKNDVIRAQMTSSQTSEVVGEGSDEAKSQYNKTSSGEVMLEYQTSKLVAHASSQSSKEGESGDMWALAKDNKVYLLMDDGASKVGRVVTPEEGQTINMDYLLTFLDEVGFGYILFSLDTVLSSIQEGKDVDADATEEYGDNVTTSLKYLTSGEGNLTVEDAVTVKDATYDVGVLKGTANGSITTKYAWDKYLPLEASYEGSIDIEAQLLGGKLNLKQTMKSSLKYSYSGDVEVPNVEDFKIVG